MFWRENLPLPTGNGDGGMGPIFITWRVTQAWSYASCPFNGSIDYLTRDAINATCLAKPHVVKLFPLDKRHKLNYVNRTFWPKV